MSAPTTPNRALKHREADTVKKTRFFTAYNSQTRPFQALARELQITRQTAHNWLKQRRIQGSPAYRRNRKRSTRLGRQPKLENEQIQHLISPSNPV